MLRNERGLVYDVQFQLHSLDSTLLSHVSNTNTLTGGWYTIKLIGNSIKMNKTILLTQEFLSNILNHQANNIQINELDASIQHIIWKITKERYTLQYWIDKLSGSQMSHMYNSFLSINYKKLLSSITISDVMNILKKIEFGSSNKEFLCTGISI